MYMNRGGLAHIGSRGFQALIAIVAGLAVIFFYFALKNYLNILDNNPNTIFQTADNKINDITTTL